MATIEERAEILCYDIDLCYTLDFCDNLHYDKERALRLAQESLAEQDRIARAEERERCVKAMQDWCCGMCTERKSHCEVCTYKDEIRKAMVGDN